MKPDDETASQRVQEFSYPWSGRIEKVGQDLLMPWHDTDHTEAGSVWVPTQKAAELASALLAHLPGGSGFVSDLMRQSLVGRIPDEHLDKAAECTTGAALLAIEHALALAAKAQEVRAKAPAARRKWGTDNIVPTGENEGIL